jgi:hypothetical protein
LEKLIFKIIFINHNDAAVGSAQDYLETMRREFGCSVTSSKPDLESRGGTIAIEV